ncbi:hypothetical protein [Persephonella sp.]|uniref:hypothetical protein n=1 Tax=Persephonella sp. TaxID=2060922 RepID=UPI002609A260|nr:hypothetical protein [Persephonella sp.]
MAQNKQTQENKQVKAKKTPELVIGVRGFYHDGKYYEAIKRNGKFIFSHPDEEVMKAASKYKVKG